MSKQFGGGDQTQFNCIDVYNIVENEQSLCINASATGADNAFELQYRRSF